jgi:hypothetical protein
MPIRTPQDPTGKTYEDMLAAFFTALGYFIETNLSKKESNNDVLELDIVITPSDGTYLQRQFVEAKSGDWGISDIFKLAGWKQYLGIGAGSLVYKTRVEERKERGAERVATALGLQCTRVNLPEGEGESAFRECISLPDEIRSRLFHVGYYLRIAERLAADKFNSACKANSSVPSYTNAKSYQISLSDAFFEPNSILRAKALYSAYFACPKLSKALVDTAVEAGKTESSVWSDVRNYNKRLPIQYCMFLEQKARIEILKNAFDRIIEKENDVNSSVDIRGFMGLDWDVLTLPPSFIEGMSWLSHYQHRFRVPFFFQVFLEILGGFYIEGDEGEKELISSLSGIPPEDVELVIQKMNDFFPFSGGWVAKFDSIACFKMVPAFVRGAGCIIRKRHYQLKSYGERFAKAASAMSMWHNALYQLLEPTLGKEIKEN